MHGSNSLEVVPVILYSRKRCLNTKLSYTFPISVVHSKDGEAGSQIVGQNISTGVILLFTSSWLQ